MSLATRRSLRLPLIAGAAALAGLVFVTSASALVRPQAATPVVVSMVIAYQPCTTPGGVPPGTENNPANLAGDACQPETRVSPWLTAGEPPGQPANFKGQVKLVVCITAASCSSGGGSGSSDVLIKSGAPDGTYLQDVRCANPGGMTNASVCANPNAAQGPDYGTTNAPTPALVTVTFDIRLTSRNTGPAGGPYTTEGTEQDLQLDLPMLCAVTAATNIGGNCVPARASLNALCGGCVPSGKLSNYEAHTVRIQDGGPDGNPFNGTGDRNDYAVQGFFVP